MKTIDYVLAIDSSPSMSHVTAVTIKGGNEVLAALRNAARETKAKVRVTILTFDSKARILPEFNAVAIEDAPKLTRYRCDGGTAIYEGLGTAIDAIKSKSSLVVINLLTDGENNTFGEYTQEQVATMVKKSQATGRYTFAILAANQDARKLGSSLGIENAADYMSDQNGTRGAFFQLARAARKFVEQASGGGTIDGKDYFETFDLEKTQMKVNGLSVTVNLPESEHDTVDGLPPYAPAEVHIVDEYPKSPANWMHGSAKASSYFTGVRENTALWFDFNANADDEHEIAAVISVQGVNPLTGQKTGTLRLEKYDRKCPVHDSEFGQERFCKECGFKWPAQNFISTTSCEEGKFWLDGFRTPDGKVHQYVFTEEMARGVANALIGEDKVYAVGIAFYKSKTSKPKPSYGGYPEMTRNIHLMATSSNTRGRISKGLRSASQVRTASAPMFFSPMHTPANWTKGSSSDDALLSAASGTLKSHHSINSVFKDGGPAPMASAASAYPELVDGVIDDTAYCLAAPMSDDPNQVYTLNGDIAAVSPKTFEVAAGEAINQEIAADPNAIDFWEEEPAGFIYVNYTDMETVKQILSAGKRKEVKSGFLSSVPVGNK